MSTTASHEQLAASFTGQLLQPTDAGYDEARRVHNGVVDKRPTLIARCHGAADVADAVKLARTLNLEVAVRNIVIEHFHGAASRVPVDQTACAMRITGFNVAIVSQWMDPSENDRQIAWARDTYTALTPHWGTTRYLNYLAADESSDAVAPAAYGPNYARLQELTGTYDPDNFSKRNVNIRPR